MDLCTQVPQCAVDRRNAGCHRTVKSGFECTCSHPIPTATNRARIRSDDKICKSRNRVGRATYSNTAARYSLICTYEDSKFQSFAGSIGKIDIPDQSIHLICIRSERNLCNNHLNHLHAHGFPVNIMSSTLETL